MKVVLEIFFLSFNNTNIKFAELKKLTWRIYTTAEALPTTSWVKLVNKKEFAKAALDENSKTFMVHVVFLKVPTAMPIYPSRIS